MTILQEKMLLIRALLDLEDSSLLLKIKQLLFSDKAISAAKIEVNNPLSIAYEAIPAFVNVEDLKKEQSYNPQKTQIAFGAWQEEKWSEKETAAALLNSIS
jgi:hypothetical protein